MTSSNDTSIPVQKTPSITDDVPSLDDRLKLWMGSLPYVWISDDRTYAFRYYFVPPDATVYDDKGNETKMYILENKTRNGSYSPIAPIYILDFKGKCSMQTKDLFRVYNPYFEKVDVSKIRDIKNVRVKGEVVDAEKLFLRPLPGITHTYLRSLQEVPKFDKSCISYRY